MSVRYTNINGQIVAEKRSGTRKIYSSDALGSTVSLYSGLTKTDSFTYWPYGETRTSSGSTPTKYKFVGTLGCREQADGGIYMRARVEEPENGRWMTVDPLWPVESAYGYAWMSPSSYVDASGTRPDEIMTDCCERAYRRYLECALNSASGANLAIAIGLTVGTSALGFGLSAGIGLGYIAVCELQAEFEKSACGLAYAVDHLMCSANYVCRQPKYKEICKAIFGHCYKQFPDQPFLSECLRSGFTRLLRHVPHPECPPKDFDPWTNR
ncbi:MAG: hypothetical protein M9921_14385 [Fimbriimonadaceae bacterium]|nr:hypothetical protein [Fimbriimonadaceae bacterium]